MDITKLRNRYRTLAELMLKAETGHFELKSADQLWELGLTELQPAHICQILPGNHLDLIPCLALWHEKSKIFEIYWHDGADPTVWDVWEINAETGDIESFW